MSDLGRFTARGGPDVEARITALIESVRNAIERAVTPNEYEAIVLIGGYGRGEGGVVTVRGVERPHNNLDFLAITKPGVDESQLKMRMDRALAPLAAQHGIGMDVGCIRASKLASAPCLVMWFDMRFGHKTVLGDSKFVPSLTRFTKERVVPYDVRNLLVNRGTLLIINELLLERELGDEDRRTVVKHAVKAIIGYGDALLFFLGDYDVSYEAKQRKMRARRDVSEAFRTLYDEAMEFRFRPHYEAYEGRDLARYNAELLETLSIVHLRCESLRLGKDVDWSSYLETAFLAELTSEPLRARSTAKKLVSFVRERRRPHLAGRRAALGFRAAGPRGQLPVVFPYVAYRVGDARAKESARAAIDASSIDHGEMVRAYLRAWSLHGDANFGAVLRKHDLSLEARS